MGAKYYGGKSGGGGHSSPPPDSLSARETNNGGAPQASSLKGSVAPGPSPEQARIDAREAAFAKNTATQNLGEQPTEIQYRQVHGVTQTIVPGQPSPIERAGKQKD